MTPIEKLRNLAALMNASNEHCPPATGELLRNLAQQLFKELEQDLAEQPPEKPKKGT